MYNIHVVIPVYNVEKYVEQAVRSVLDQPYKGIDIVLVDDGSPDNSPAICDRLASAYDRIHVIHKANGGVSSARNTGIEYFLEKYDNGYIAFLDADDAWVPDAVTDSISDSINNQWLDDIVCFSNCRCNNDMSRFAPVVYQEEKRVSPAYKEIWPAQNTHMCSKLYSINLIKNFELKFIDGQQYSEDIMFIYQTVFLADSIRYLSRPLYLYRSNPGGMMSGILKRSAIDHFKRIADGWVKSDDFINTHIEVTKRKAETGYILAGVYLLDMARYHYRQHGASKKLKEVLVNHPQYEIFLNMQKDRVSAVQVKDRDMFVKHHFAFKLKYNIIGIVDKIGRVIVGSKLIAPWWEKRKFPLTYVGKV